MQRSRPIRTLESDWRDALTHDRAHAVSGQNLLLDAAINNMSSGLIVFDASERIVVCNRRYIEMFGLSPDIVKPGCSFDELLAHRVARGTISGDIERYKRELRESLARNRSYSHIVRIPDGRYIGIDNQPMANGGWVGIYEDITERRNATSELKRARAFLDTVIENVPVSVFVKDARSLRYILVNRAAEALWGLSRDEIVGKTADEVLPKKAADAITACEIELLRHRGSARSHGTYQIETPANGSHLVDVRRVVVPGDDGEPQYLLVVMENITERVRANERISYMAHHDLLTGLANRVLFLEKLEHAATRLKDWAESFTIFMLDLDRFKEVNDSRGHPAGDALLRDVAQRLKSVLRESDVLARLGGDEFAILRVVGAGERGRASLLAKQVIGVLTEPFDIEGSKVVIGASIGIAQAPADGIEPSELMKKADLALYRKKSSGRNGYCFFDPRMTAEADVRHRLEQDLRDAIANGELNVHYQAIVDVSSGRTCAVEALVRWHHPQHGNIPPAQFIPLAEESGLITPLGEWVLKRACFDAAGWPPDIKIAVNLSPAQFRSADLMDVIVSALVESGLAPERLELEITESVLIESRIDVLAVVRQLKEIGISIALDDFGTGYSSLSYLTMLPFDKIKIDKFFTQNITKRAECAAIVSSVLTLGHCLGIVTTAEGVETEEQFALLRAAGVRTVQGYLFGRPCPAAEIVLGLAAVRSTASAA